MSKKFKVIVAAGTFDRLHIGHKFFLKKAFELAEQVFVGITTDQFVKKKLLGTNILFYNKRLKTLQKFLKSQGWLSRTTFFPLNDAYGPAIKNDSPIEAIVVTAKTVAGAREVNRRRQQLGLSELAIMKIPLIKDDKQSTFSSQNQRVSELLGENLALPNVLRPALQKPLGQLFEGSENNLPVAAQKAKDIIAKENPPLIITVGDVVTKSFNQLRVPIALAIVDFKIKREEKIKNLQDLGFEKKKPDYTVNNLAGTISSSLSKVVKKAIQQYNNSNNYLLIIRVLGEEDLAVLPAIVFAPINTAIFYGQPPHQSGSGQAQEGGIIYIKVNQAIKNKVAQLLSHFTTSPS